MKALSLRIEPFESLRLKDFQMELKVNNHGSVIFTGFIDYEDEEKYLNMVFNNTWSAVYAIDELEQEELIFNGIISNLRVTAENGVKMLRVELKTGSYIMDNNIHIRSFQKSNSSYNDCLNTIMNVYPEWSMIMTAGKNCTIQDFLLQYRETDWEFTKRLASHHNSLLVAEYRTPGVKFYFGMPNGSGIWELEENTYDVEKRLDEYYIKLEYGLSISEWDTICYKIKSREFHDIGEAVILNGKTLFIDSILSKWEKEELVHQYCLRPKKAFLTVKFYNDKIIGASLEGHITEVKGDSVKVKVMKDENGMSGERWFPYSTVYSSPDGSGWYCMPEVGDCVRIYLPNEREKHAYAISSVHLEAGDGSSRSNPDFKTIKNKEGKEVTFEPGRIYMTNNKGMMIEINDKEGIRIESDKGISISSKSSLGIISEEQNLELMSPGEISLKQGGNSFTLKEEVVLDGAKVNLQ